VALFLCAGRANYEGYERREVRERLSRLSLFSPLRGSTPSVHTVLSVSNAQGTSQGHLWYDPHGSVLSSTLPVTLTDRLFTGQRLDNSTGLYYYNARYYDPHLGRFIQPDSLVPDPLNPQAWNRFSYVYNNPASYVDPGGHQPEGWSWWDVIGTAFTFDIFAYTDLAGGLPRGTTASRMQKQLEEVQAWQRRNIREPVYARFPVVKTIGEIVESPEFQMGLMAAMMTTNPPIIEPVAPSGGREGWQAYEARHGATHPRYIVEYEGQPTTIVPDHRTLNGSTIIEMKALNFSNPAYQKSFIQECVIRDIVTQAGKYSATGKPVVFQFSQTPPLWLSEVLDSLSVDASVSYIVVP